jgi:hypothetical protein
VVNRVENFDGRARAHDIFGESHEFGVLFRSKVTLISCGVLF